MSVIKDADQNQTDFSVELSDMDYRQLRSFEAMLKSSVEAAEETLATAKNRHAIFLRMLQRLEEENGIEKGYLESKYCSFEHHQQKRA